MKFRNALLGSALLLVPGLAAAQPVSGLYVAGGIGANWLMETDLNSSGQLSTALQNAGRSTRGEVSYEWGYVGVVSLGWGFGNGVRAEVEGNYRINDLDDVSGFGGTSGASGSAISYGVMGNVFYDFDLASWGSTPAESTSSPISAAASAMSGGNSTMSASMCSAARCGATILTGASPTRLSSAWASRCTNMCRD